MASLLWKPLSRLSALHTVCARLRTGARCSLSGVHTALLGPLLCALKNELAQPLLVLTATPDEADVIAQDLHTLHGRRAAFFPVRTWEREEVFANEPTNLERLETLQGLVEGRIDIVIAPCVALLQDVPARQVFASRTLHLRVGQSIDLVELMRLLFEHGYERVELIEFPGECSARGGIVDIFPITSEHPIRIEFLGNEICSLRYFDVHTQRTRPHGEVGEVTIPPARESALESGELVNTLLAYFTTRPVVVWCEYRRVLGHVERLSADAEQSPGWPRLRERFAAWLRASKGHAMLYVQELAVDVPDELREENYHIETEPLRLESVVSVEREAEAKPLELALRSFVTALRGWRERGYAVAVACATDADRERLRELLTREAGVEESEFELITAPLSGSWIVPAVRQVTVTDNDIFRRAHVRRRARRRRQARSAPIENIATIAPGEYVVHVNHGIGQFEGIRAVEINGMKREMVVVRYADNALLYVPLEQAHLLERYISVGEGVPQLDTLGTGHWAARTRRAARAVLDLAAELLERQAQRAALPGFAFPPDDEWQRAFERSFPYTETVDQARAILEVKRDMEAARPMDRLICGDVGFGKTEVALRAAFKAVAAGKQVAVLVPTTLLAQQHWHTFSERLAPYPVRVGVLSRFVSARLQRETLAELANGRLDIVIGTHRLLAPDVVFRDLGLIIIDEEHRFGVRHKEALKKVRTLADVLSLSATPIPRTLYAALTGARDMSVINTPPEDRLPVVTHLIKRDYRVIREAILRELARGGQVFFIHNRVETIERTCDVLQQLVPQARFAVAHGQMADDDLAETMEAFERREFDVLVSTMIVESGLDLPNVNTLFVDDAHLFGLADLYQLRGRVGRSARQAYAYFIVPVDLVLDGAARQRLKAILEHTALGSGYAIAMRDLEIRGAGNLLGTEQSGHIAAVGFNLYCRLLQRAVELLKHGKLAQGAAVAEAGEGTATRYDWRKELPLLQPREDGVELRLPFTGNIPAEYVESAALRLDLFRRIAQATRRAQLQALEEELRDRFGPLPLETVVLLRLAETRIRARSRGIDCIECIEGKVVFRRRGAIMNAGKRLPRIAGLNALEAIDVIREHLEQMPAITR